MIRVVMNRNVIIEALQTAPLIHGLIADFPERFEETGACCAGAAIIRYAFDNVLPRPLLLRVFEELVTERKSSPAYSSRHGNWLYLIDRMFERLCYEHVGAAFYDVPERHERVRPAIVEWAIGSVPISYGFQLDIEDEVFTKATGGQSGTKVGMAQYGLGFE